MKKVALICLVLMCLLIVGCQEEQLGKAGKPGLNSFLSSIDFAFSSARFCLMCFRLP
jgi:hypothetical protein